MIGTLGAQIRRSSFLVLSVLFASVGASAMAASWQAYEANALPTESEPRWRAAVDHNRSGDRVELAKDGLLHVITAERTDNLAWYVGTQDTSNGDANWMLDQGSGATVDFRVRVLESTPGGTFQLQVADGADHWTFSFDTGAAKLQRQDGKPIWVRHGNRALTRFRVAVRNGAASLYLAGRERPLIENVGPTAPRAVDSMPSSAARAPLTLLP